MTQGEQQTLTFGIHRRGIWVALLLMGLIDKEKATLGWQRNY
jgi:hypothetical protein